MTFETTSFFPLTSLPLFKGVKNDMKTLKCMLTDFEMKNPLKISQEVKEGRKKNFQPNTFNNNKVKKNGNGSTQLLLSPDELFKTRARK